MTSSTLVVGFSEIQVSSFVELVTARGIDRVIVVGSNADFSDGNAIAGVTAQASSLQSAGIEVQLAQGSSDQTLPIPQTNFQAIKSAGLEFLNDPGFASFTQTTTFVLPSGTIQANGNNALFTSFDFDTLSNNNIGSDSAGNSLALTSRFSQQSSVDVTGDSFSSSNTITDFNGTLKINVSANEFRSYLESGHSTSSISSPSNITLTDSLSTFSITGEIDGLVDFTVSQINNLNSKASNLAYHGPNVDTPKGASNNFRFSDGGSISADQALLLPDMGILPSSGGIVQLTGTSSEISCVLSKLTLGQLSSFDRIVSSDGQPIVLDLNTLTKLDEAGDKFNIPWATNSNGLSVVDSSDNDVALVLTTNQISAFLQMALI